MRKQENFYAKLGLNNKLSHGGDLRVGRRKIMRPLDSKRPLHVVLRSSKARGSYSFLNPRNKLRVENLIRAHALRFAIKIAQIANVGNHLHLNLRFNKRKNIQGFLRTLTALIARLVTGARKGIPFGKFWDNLAFTRVVTTKKEIASLTKYIAANLVEAVHGKDRRERYLKNRTPWELRMYGEF